MADPYQLPGRVGADANTLPKRADLEALTYFILGNKGDDNTATDGKNQGWLGLPNSPMSVVSPSVAKVRSTLAPLNINRSNNSWHGQDEYAIQTGTFSPWRHWENCAEHHPEKDVLGRRGMFDLFRARNGEFHTSERVERLPHSDGLGGHHMYDTLHITDAHTPDNIHETWSPALTALGDKDKTIALHKRWAEKGDMGLVNMSGPIARFHGEIEAVQTANIMRNTGFGVRQSRDMIDQFARLRVAKALEPKAGAARLSELAGNLPTTKEVADQLKEAQGEYRSFLVNLKDKVKLTRHIGNDIKALESYVAAQPEGSIAREIGTQLLGEYKVVQSTLTKARDMVVPDGPNKGKKWSELPGYDYLNAETLDPKTIARLHGDSDTRNAFFNGGSGISVNTGWLWTAHYSGLDHDTLSKSLDPANPDAGNHLSQALRFIGQQRERMFTQALFDPEKAGGHRDLMKIEMVDPQRMTQALLNPKTADLPELAHLMSAAYEAQFVTPTDKHARRKYGVYRLCTAFDTGNNFVNIKQTQRVVEALKTGKYDNGLSYLGITQSDFNGILSLLAHDGATSLTGPQADSLDRFFKQLAEKHGKDGYISKDALFMASAPIEVKVTEGVQVSYALIDGNGKAVTIGEPIKRGDSPNGSGAYNAAYKQAAQFNGINQGFDRFIQELALAPQERPLNGLYCQGPSLPRMQTVAPFVALNAGYSPYSAGLVLPALANEVVRVNPSPRPSRPVMVTLGQPLLTSG